MKIIERETDAVGQHYDKKYREHKAVYQHAREQVDYGKYLGRECGFLDEMHVRHDRLIVRDKSFVEKLPRYKAANEYHYEGHASRCLNPETD